ncbi:MAG: hypothetical protein KJ630_22760 [Proteobacteria bacterium]|nr:hypothetical protein [Pseudomonadota bacterium]
MSRYFKNTPSFQAEDLVKQTDNISSGWTPNPRKDQRPFQTQQAPLPTASRDSFPEKASTAPQHSPFENNTVNGNLQAKHPPQSSAKDNNTLPVAESPVDLSIYLDRAEAERNATEAYKQGLEEGREKADQDFGAAAMALLLACQQMDTLRATIIGNSSKELLDFSLAIAERIIRFSVHEYDHTIVATVEEALRRAVKSDEFTIYIHPDDYDTLAAKSAEIIAGLSGLNNIVIKKDAAVARGGTLIESDNCTIDATISGQFEVIREELKKNS